MGGWLRFEGIAELNLSKLDDYPIHHTSYPVGYAGMRVTPKADIVGGYAALNLSGKQRSLRLRRIWSDDCDLHIGPLSYRVVRP
jgi:hypothetical protein